jgi:hypothetical protein
MDLLSLAIGFVVGAITGAAGHYYGEKYSDQRRQQEADRRKRQALDRLRAQMPKLFDELIADVRDDKNGFTRQVFVLPTRGTMLGGTTQGHFIYYESEHESLREQLDLIKRAGFLDDWSSDKTPRYLLEEDFVAYLRRAR